MNRPLVKALLTLCLGFSFLSVSPNLMAQSHPAQVNLFSEYGIPLYEIPEGDFSLLRNPLELAKDPFAVLPQFEVDGRPIQAGTELVLETGEVILFRELLGAGFYTIVIRDMENRVIRLARHTDAHSMEMHLQFMEAALLLSSVVESRFLVQLSPQQMQSTYTTQVELLNIEMTLDEYLSQGIESSDPRYRELLEFFNAFSRVRDLGADFLPKQIGYVRGRGWVLFDLSAGVKILKKGEPSNNPLNHLRNWSMQIEQIGITIETLEQLEDDILKKAKQSHSLLMPAEVVQCREIFIKIFY